MHFRIIHSVTRFAPSYLLHGVSKDFIPDVLQELPDLASDRKIAFENSVKSHEYNKKYYDKFKSDIIFSVGVMVYIDNGSKLNKEKLDELRVGPFPISRKLSNSVYEIDVGRGDCSKRLYHTRKIKIFAI